MFSSTCSTGGDPQTLPISEDHIQNPVNPYGQSKLIVEKMLRDFDSVYGMKSVSLRYFNAAGADPEGETGEDHTPETYLIPLVLDAALGNRPQVATRNINIQDGSHIAVYLSHIHPSGDVSVSAHHGMDLSRN